jgi:hypothetical protein
MIREHIQISLSITTPTPRAKCNEKLKDYQIKPLNTETLHKTANVCSLNYKTLNLLTATAIEVV